MRIILNVFDFLLIKKTIEKLNFFFYELYNKAKLSKILFFYFLHFLHNVILYTYIMNIDICYIYIYNVEITNTENFKFYINFKNKYIYFFCKFELIENLAWFGLNFSFPINFCWGKGHCLYNVTEGRCGRHDRVPSANSRNYYGFVEQLFVAPSKTSMVLANGV